MIKLFVSHTLLPLWSMIEFKVRIKFSSFRALSRRLIIERMCRLKRVISCAAIPGGTKRILKSTTPAYHHFPSQTHNFSGWLSTLSSFYTSLFRLLVVESISIVSTIALLIGHIRIRCRGWVWRGSACVTQMTAELCIFLLFVSYQLIIKSCLPFYLPLIDQIFLIFFRITVVCWDSLCDRLIFTALSTSFSWPATSCTSCLAFICHYI